MFARLLIQPVRAVLHMHRFSNKARKDQVSMGRLIGSEAFGSAVYICNTQLENLNHICCDGICEAVERAGGWFSQELI